MGSQDFDTERKVFKTFKKRLRIQTSPKEEQTGKFSLKFSKTCFIIRQNSKLESFFLHQNSTTSYNHFPQRKSQLVTVLRVLESQTHACGEGSLLPAALRLFYELGPPVNSRYFYFFALLLMQNQTDACW